MRAARAVGGVTVLIVAAGVAAGCSIRSFTVPASYEGPAPLPAQLAARFAYEPAPIAPEITQKGETETYEHLRGVYATTCPVTRRRTRVQFELYRSKVGEGPRPCIVIVPILAGRYPECEHLGDLFTRNGMHAFFVHREDDLIAKTNEPADFETIMRRSIVNIRRTLDWVAARPDVDPEKIGLCGISLGAIAGSIVTAVEPRVKRSVLIMGGGDLPQILWRSREWPVRFWRAAAKARWNVDEYEPFRERIARDFVSDPLVFAPYVDARRVLQFVARFDDRVPTECQWKLWEAFGRPSGYAMACGHYSAIFYVGFAEEKAIAFYREAFDTAPAADPAGASVTLRD